MKDLISFERKTRLGPIRMLFITTSRNICGFQAVLFALAEYLISASPSRVGLFGCSFIEMVTNYFVM